MRLEKFITRQRIIDLISTDLKGALAELLEVSVSRFSDLNPDALLRGLLQRENTMTTYLGLGVALPHVRVKMRRRYVLAIGRSPAGIRYDGAQGQRADSSHHHAARRTRRRATTCRCSPRSRGWSRSRSSSTA